MAAKKIYLLLFSYFQVVAPLPVQDLCTLSPRVPGHHVGEGQCVSIKPHLIADPEGIYNQFPVN